MKKSFSLLAAVFPLVLNGYLVLGQQIIVQLEAGNQVVLSRSDLEALPRVQVSVDSSSGSAMFAGVTVHSVLERAGVGFGESLKGRRLASCLMVEAADRYRVLIALPELDPAFTSKQILLAFLRNGAPLDAKQGPYRIIIPDEKRMARWVKQVTMLKIVDVP